MFSSIRIQNFKALRDATIPLGPVTLLVGPNGSGKSTVLQALRMASRNEGLPLERIRSVQSAAPPSIDIKWTAPARTHVTFSEGGGITRRHQRVRESAPDENELNRLLAATRFYSFDPDNIAAPVTLQPGTELNSRGGNLVAVLDQLRDRDPERFQRLNADLQSWLPEFDQILFETPNQGQRELLLRLAGSKSGIRASELSHGTLFALVLLALANLPVPPPFVAIEEPDRGVHPRMLRRVQDALYRLAFPEAHGESRKSVQVVATTHSPFMLDLYRDHPEHVVISEKRDSEASFIRLTERADMKELLGDVGLGDLWYSGILGGVPLEA
jgi:predicted ATPase